MEKVNKLLQTIAMITKSEDDDLKDLIGIFPATDALIELVNEYEKNIAKIFKKQKKHFIDGIESYVAKDDDGVTIAAIINYLLADLLAADEFAQDMEEESQAFLYMTIPQLTATIMEMIDEHIPFIGTSKETVDWIHNWSHDLADLMKLSTHESIDRVLQDALTSGKGMNTVVNDLAELPDFSRKRAWMTAVTEVLTASSVAQNEAYKQSPVVTGKTWLHSGSKKNTPRPAHVALNDTTIPKDQKFDVNGYAADFPRDTSLPAKERVRCHCAMAPGVDEEILGLTKEEKEAIRQEVITDPDFEAKVAEMKANAKAKYAHDWNK